MTKNSIIFRGGYDKGDQVFIADKNLFVSILIFFACVLIYFNKRHTFSVNYLKM